TLDVDPRGARRRARSARSEGNGARRPGAAPASGFGLSGTLSAISVPGPASLLRGSGVVRRGRGHAVASTGAAGRGFGQAPILNGGRAPGYDAPVPFPVDCAMCRHALLVGRVLLCLTLPAPAAPAPKLKGHATPQECFKAIRTAMKKNDMKAFMASVTDDAQE